jgi:hypothetical protein
MRAASSACLVPCYVKGARASGLSVTRLSGTRSQIGESSGGNIRHQVTRGVVSFGKNSATPLRSASLVARKSGIKAVRGLEHNGSNSATPGVGARGALLLRKNSFRYRLPF